MSTLFRKLASLSIPFLLSAVCGGAQAGQSVKLVAWQFTGVMACVDADRYEKRDLKAEMTPCRPSGPNGTFEILNYPLAKNDCDAYVGGFPLWPVPPDKPHHDAMRCLFTHETLPPYTMAPAAASSTAIMNNGQRAIKVHVYPMYVMPAY